MGAPFKHSILHAYPVAAVRPLRHCAARTYILVALAAMMCAPAARAQRVVATVDGRPVTDDELRMRAALTVFPGRERAGAAETFKREFLLSIIAERLLAAEARKNALAGESTFTASRARAEAMFVRDKLYRDSVRARVTIPEAELRAEYARLLRETEYRYIVTESDSAARALHAALRAGLPFDTVLATWQGSDSTRAAAAVPVTEPLERSLAAVQRRLRPGAFSEPVRIAARWYIVHRRDVAREIASDEDFAARSRRIENDLRGAREAARAADLVRRLWTGRKAVFGDSLYRALGDAVVSALRTQLRADSTATAALGAGWFDDMRARAGARIDSPFARIDGEALSYGAVLELLEGAGVRAGRTMYRRLPDVYRAAVKEALDRHILTREGYRLGLQHSDAVRADMALWEESGLAHSLPDVLFERATAVDDSVWALYARYPDLFGGPPRARIVEVLTRDRALTAEALAAVGDTARFRRLAATRSERPGAVERNGEYGPFILFDEGALGKAVFALRPGGVGGPVSLGEQVSVFRLLALETPGDSLRDMRTLRAAVDSRLRAPLSARLTADRVRALAARADIRINEEELRALSLPATQMFTLRFLGFGGRIPAVPGLAPLFGPVFEGMSAPVRTAP